MSSILSRDAAPEERLRVLEERLLAQVQSLLTLAKDLMQLREDMAAGEGGPTDHDDTSSS
ncbi:hypothetical protein [Pseudomonas sp. B1-22]|uniref:hypothetical protein n=1 Tax=Pseudomonas sp. B1-22 TaxID=3141456 RepID=UPI003D2E5015